MKIFTPEERAAALVKSAESRKAKEAFAKENFKLSFVDEDHWRALAKKAGTRLCQKNLPATESKYIKRLLVHLGKDVQWFLDISGVGTLKELAAMNPKWPCYAVMGIVLEEYYEELRQSA